MKQTKIFNKCPWSVLWSHIVNFVHKVVAVA